MGELNGVIFRIIHCVYIDDSNDDSEPDVYISFVRNQKDTLWKVVHQCNFPPQLKDRFPDVKIQYSDEACIKQVLFESIGSILVNGEILKRDLEITSKVIKRKVRYKKQIKIKKIIERNNNFFVDLEFIH